MTKKRNFTAFMIAIMIMLFLLPANAQETKGYVHWYEPESEPFGTLTFYGGDMPSGTSLYELNTGKNYPGWLEHMSYCTKVVFDVSFKDVRPTSCYNWFNEFYQLTEIEGIENLNTSEVTDMESMFKGCSKLTSLDVSNFNTANVTTMYHMFAGCSGLTSLDVSNFNIANVTTMESMFQGCSRLKSLNLSNINTDNVMHMSFMFSGCSGLTSLDVSNFNTANVTKMGGMFQGCSGLNSIDLSNFNTDNVERMGDMFNGCSGLTSLDLSNFNTDKVKKMESMFQGCSKLTSLDVSKFNTAKVTRMHSMFQGCSGLTSLDVSKFNTDKVTDMGGMFMDCSGLTSLDVSNFNTDNVTKMGTMFRGCSGLTSLDLSNFKTANVTSMGGMFMDCSGLTSLDLSSFNTAKVKQMNEMFYGCSSLMTIYVSDYFTTSAAVYFGSEMFTSCSKLKGAASFDPAKTDYSMANYTSGYFKTYFTLGENKVELFGEPLTTESLDLSGDDVFVAHAPFTANTATYSRDLSMSESTWFSLCLPFAYTPQNFTAYQLMSATADAVEIEKISTETIAAGMPVLFKFNDNVVDKTINLSATEANIVKAPVDGTAVTGTDGSSLQLCGTYQNKSFSEEDGNAFILLNDKLMNPAKMLENENVTTVGVKPFCAYMTLTASEPQSARAFSIGRGDEGGGTTAIDLLNSVATDDAEYYDINGRRIDAPAKGVNIVRRGNKTIKLIIK